MKRKTDSVITLISSLLCAATVLSCAACSGGRRTSETDGASVSTSDADVRRPGDDVVIRPDETDDETDAVTAPAESDVLPIADETLDLDVKAPQCFVFDTQSGELIYMKGKGEKLYPASTTKLLTIMYALTVLDPEMLVTPGDELSLVGEFSTIAYVKPNHTLSVEMLIEGMLLPSGNDAAYVPACAAGRKLSDDPKGIPAVDAVALFIDGMNEYANSIGMTGSHFTCPDGYPDEDHYSTVEDMAIISAIAVKNSIIKKYARILVDNVVYASQHTNKWTNSNKLLDPSGEFYSPYATGLKTGSADNNYSFIASADIEGVTYIAGFFTEEHPNDRFVDALTVIKALEDRLP